MLDPGLRTCTLDKPVARTCENTAIGWTLFGLSVRHIMRHEKLSSPKITTVERPRLAIGIL